MSQIPVAAIITFFNAAAYADEPITSVLRQSLPPAQIILVDDGSSDGTLQILLQHAREHANIMLIHQSNRWIGAARNAGLRQASQEFVAFLDGDDRWKPDKLQLQLAHMQACPACSIILNGTENFVQSGVLRPEIVAADHAPGVHRAANLGAMLIRRTAFNTVGLLNEQRHFADDLDWLMRATQLGLRIDMDDVPMLERRLHASNASNDGSTRDHGMLKLAREALLRRRAQTDVAPSATVVAIIPIYNNARTLAAAIESVQQQTTPVDEIILIDDGSSDASADVALAFAHRDARIVYIRQSNAGTAAARNAGIRASKSTFIAPLDADDLWLPEKTEMQLRYMRDNPDCFALLNASENFEEMGWVNTGGRTQENVPGPYAGLLPGAMLFRRRLFDIVGLHNPLAPNSSELELLARAQQFGIKLHRAPETLQRRRLHANNTSRNVAMMQHELLQNVHRLRRKP